MFGSEPLSHVTFYNINIGMSDDALVFLTHTIEYFTTITFNTQAKNNYSLYLVEK